MKFVSVRDLRSKSAQIWKNISIEKDMVITSNGRPIALLSQIAEDSFEESLAAIRSARAIQAVETIQAHSHKLGKDQITLKEINTEIQSVRRNRK